MTHAGVRRIDQRRVCRNRNRFGNPSHFDDRIHASIAIHFKHNSHLMNFLKPCAVASTRYVPKGSALKMYFPDSSARTVRLKLVSCCVTLISTPGTTAPVVSVTVPKMEEDVTCASNAGDTNNSGNGSVKTIPRLIVSSFLSILRVLYPAPKTGGY